MPEIRDVISSDVAQLLLLNNAAVPAVNPHDDSSFSALLSIADRTWVVDDHGLIGGVLVAFAPGAPYQSRNYRRLNARYADFLYVDRIVIAPTHRRQQLATRLYGRLADHARASGHRRLLCEVNLEPPNPQSIAFHEAAGWDAIEDHQHEPGQVVRYFSLGLE